MPKGPADFLLRMLQRELGALRARGVKDVLFDPVTSLPTLPVLLPYIRKILAEPLARIAHPGPQPAERG